MTALWVLGGYLSGSVPYGLFVVRHFVGKDVRDEGSGNIGATNVARVAGKQLGVMVLLLDALKGLLPVLLARVLVPEEPWLHAGVGLAAFLGHCFPVWLRFEGGKGVATALGVLLVLLPWAALAGFAVYAVIFAVWRVSSIGSLAGALTAVAVGAFTAAAWAYGALAAIFLGLIVFTHRANIGRLVRKEEKKV
ncbi:MAG: glycerol-3-phosphate 1-O-acyltransferase PlsY [Myxococcaceae bacterium]|nr:glycerol-3-phosphate 1-O-acyltransferase PlsY [Myxococcaceae bacterium]